VALDFVAMRTEVFARGLSDLNDGGAGLTRVKRWIVDAAHEIDVLADWPYKMSSTTGTAPLTIADLDVVECVTDVSNLSALQPTDRRYLRTTYGDLTTTGTAGFYYFTAQTTIATYPVSTATLTVDYWKVGPDLSADADVPLMPDRFRMGIVHYAVAAALTDRGDLQGAQLARQDGDRVVSQMMASLLVPSHQAAAQWVPAVGDDQ
jgi:hypothetical protein